MIKKIVWILAVAAMLVTTVPGTLPAGESSASNDWRFAAEMYFWYASMEGKSASGNDFDIQADDLVNNFDFGFMGMLGVNKGNWSFVTDVIYLDVSDDTDGVITGVTGNPINTRLNVKVKGWVVTPVFGYTFLRTDKVKLDAVAGARYLWLKTELDVNVSGERRGLYREDSISGGQWDGIVGLRTQFDLTENWYIPLFFDIGAGDSNLTWQLMGSVGYRFKYLDVVAGYRYIEWDFDDNDVFDDLYMQGPYAGVKFTF